MMLNRTPVLRSWIVTALFFLGSWASSLAVPERTTEITMQRRTNGSKATIGVLSVNGEVVCEFLEYPRRAPFKFLPAGTYGAFARDHNGQWRLELTNTAPFTHIQIHVGNSLPDSQGCFLAGKNADAEKPWIAQSADAMAALKTAVEKFGGKITIVIKDPS